MGMMDFVASLFGGGCKMTVVLDAKQVPVGGILAGKATLIGTSKEYPVTSVNVRLLYVHVEKQKDSAIPKVDTRILVDNAIVTKTTIGANARTTYDFTLQIPGGTEPSAHNVSYQVLVAADIPGLKDPSAKADLKVVPAEEGAVGMGLAGLYSRWPALQGTAEQPLVQAIRDLGWAHSDYNDESNFRFAEPVLAKFLRHDVARVRSTALEAWSRVLGDEATADNVKTLAAYFEASDPQGDEILEAIEAAARFAKVGGLKLIEPWAKHERDAIREKVAQSIGLYARDVGKGLIVLEKMMDDDSPHVRAQVVDALGDFDGNGVVMQKLAQLAQNPGTSRPELLKLPAALRRGSWKFGDIVWPAVTTLAKNNDAEVRRQVAYTMGSFEERPDAPAVVNGLLADADPDVRSTMSFEICNFAEAHAPTYRPVLEKMAETDVVGTVRTNAISSLAKGRPVDEVVGYYRGWMQRDPTEDVLRGIVHGIKFQADPQYKELLKELARCPFPKVAKEAQDGFEFQA